jgi:hypothetical protein
VRLWFRDERDQPALQLLTIVFFVSCSALLEFDIVENIRFSR